MTDSLADHDASESRPITAALLAAIAHSTEPMALSDPRLPDHPIIAVNAGVREPSPDIRLRRSSGATAGCCKALEPTLTRRASWAAIIASRGTAAWSGW